MVQMIDIQLPKREDCSNHDGEMTAKVLENSLNGVPLMAESELIRWRAVSRGCFIFDDEPEWVNSGF